jgi:hypothetical protein
MTTLLIVLKVESWRSHRGELWKIRAERAGGAA